MHSSKIWQQQQCQTGASQRGHVLVGPLDRPKHPRMPLGLLLTSHGEWGQSSNSPISKVVREGESEFPELGANECKSVSLEHRKACGSVLGGRPALSQARSPVLTIVTLSSPSCKRASICIVVTTEILASRGSAGPACQPRRPPARHCPPPSPLSIPLPLSAHCKLLQLANTSLTQWCAPGAHRCGLQAAPQRPAWGVVHAATCSLAASVHQPLLLAATPQQSLLDTQPSLLHALTMAMPMMPCKEGRPGRM